MSSPSSSEAFHSAPVGSQVWELTGEVTDLTDFSDPVQVKSKSRRTSKNVVRSPGVILWCSHFSCRNAEKPSRKCGAVPLEISPSRIWKHLETCQNQSLWSFASKLAAGSCCRRTTKESQEVPWRNLPWRY